MRRRLSSHVAFLLACGALWSCGGKRGLLVNDGGRADLGAEVGPTTDSVLPDRPGDPSGPSASETGDARQADGAAEAPAADLRPATLDQGEPAEASGPATATPSGGCVPGIITPSLAYQGVVGIDFDEDGIPDEVDRCPALATSSQSDSDGDGLGDACDRCSGGADGDQDGVCDAADNCPVDWNPAQYDIDGNRVGDRCDSPRCFFALATEEVQRVLQRLLREPEFTAPLADAHWRLISTQTYCRNDAMAYASSTGPPDRRNADRGGREHALGRRGDRSPAMG